MQKEYFSDYVKRVGDIEGVSNIFTYATVDVYKRQVIIIVLQFTDGLKKAHRRNGFVSLSFPQAPVTLFIILCYFESPCLLYTSSRMVFW